MVAGLASSGVDVLRLGVVPTPAVAYLTAALDAELGVMLSASHNPAPDNGIKLFALGGLKLPDAVEDEIELRLRGRAPGPVGADAGPDAGPALPGDGFGRVRDASGEAERISRPPALDAGWPWDGLPLGGLRIVVDCAHGSASALAPLLLSRAGADVVADRRGARRAEHQ